MLFLQLSPGSSVCFCLTDVFCPDLDQIREKITDSLEVTGRVIFLSDAGERPDHFAVVEVDGIMSPLIVPVDQIKAFGPMSSNVASGLKRD